ncbi:DNA cytosine methyltransferase [Massilia sp. TSP1-1-2]|uniref:DNA cytosine methyltransferase n=1 Tax=Massilia sp. TSP1-1-2 TaxID=2804649 RepID=UPI003CF3C424
MKRDAFTLSLDLGHELAVDNFAGGGGASEAIRAALGRDPDIAINHDGEALCMHSANHPTTKHYREDVYLINPGFVTKQQPIGLAWFSPTCTHFSKAKGGNLLNQKIRGLAWVTLKWAVMQMPRLMFLENVEEFQGWGPLDEAGKAIKAHKGRTFAAFIMALTTGIPEGHPDVAEIHETLGGDFPMERLYKGLGYDVQWKVLRACDFGAPTIRKRLFMVMRRDRNPIVWPTPTHAVRDSAEVKAGKLKPFLSAADCIDWSIPCPSIFTRKKQLAPATMRRIGKGYERYVKDAASPYIVETAHSDMSPTGVKRWGSGVRDIQDPLQTVLAGGNGAALVAPTFLPLTHQGSDRTSSPHDPLPTVTCANRGEMALAVASMVQMGYGEAPGQEPRALDISDPLGTIVAGGGKHAVVAAHITKFNTGSVGQSANDPLLTITSGGGSARPAGAAHGLGIVAASLVQYYSGGSQNLPADGPMPTIVTKDRVGVTTAFLAKHYKGVVGASVEAPMPTVTTVDHNSVVTAHLVGIDNQSNGAGITWDAANPLTTVTTENRHAVVTSNLVKLRGTSNAAAVDEPLGTASAGGTHHAEIRTTLARTPESLERREQVRAFLREYCPSLKDAEFPELVTINGEIMEVVDIGLRMLTPRELANAQGFRADYILDPFYTSVNKRGKTVTKRLSGSAQVRMIGNSVSPPPATALILANTAHERAMARAA